MIGRKPKTRCDKGGNGNEGTVAFVEKEKKKGGRVKTFYGCYVRRIYRADARGKYRVMVRGARSGALAASFKQTRHTVHDWRRKFGSKGSLLLLLLRILVGLCYVTSSNCDWKERMPRGTNSLRIAPSRPPQLGHCDLEETCDWSWFQNQTVGFKKIAPASMRNKNGPIVDASNSTKGKAHSARCCVPSTRKIVQNQSRRNAPTSTSMRFFVQSFCHTCVRARTPTSASPRVTQHLLIFIQTATWGAQMCTFPR